MGEIVNLRRIRKRQLGAEAEIKAAANRVAFGVSKSVRSKAQTERVLADRRLEAHRRPDPGDAE
ncbi:DUF4169 family protein [Methylocapsa sp. S129]|uniref:DUF4169 family protein n=1 Tax=Methylocapsa sp. S129 TaxID=1641869 RepID=UPI00131B7F9F|nr:DUF4169 family protein [Methylocapsa sp. S129]